MAGILIDTCVLISLVDDSRKNHENAVRYIVAAIEQRHLVCVSALSVAEFSVKQNFSEVLENFPEMRVVAFDGEHAKTSAEVFPVAREENPNMQRALIKVDTMLIGQAIASGMDFILSEDEGSLIPWAKKYCERTGHPLRVISISENFSEDVFSSDGQRELSLPKNS